MATLSRTGDAPGASRRAARAPTSGRAGRAGRALAAAGAVAALLAGCSGGGDGGPGAPGSGGDGATPALGAALPAGDAVGFAAAEVRIAESARHLAVDVVRTGDGVGATTVAWRTLGGGAAAHDDFTAADGRLAWADGETGARRIDVTVHSDADAEGDEGFEIALAPVSGVRPELRALPVTIEDAPCDASLPARIDTDATIDAPCTRLTGDAVVGGRARLRLAPGATLVASAGTGLELVDAATLELDGTPTRPVALVGANRTPGHWRGVRVASTSPLHALSHALVADAATGVEFAGAGPVRVAASRFDNTVEAALVLPLEAAAALDGSIAFTRSAGGVALTGSRVEAGEPVTLPAIATHYAVRERVFVADALTLEPGVEARFGLDGLVWVTAEGSIDARGTAAAPIVLRGAVAEPGHWRGLRLVGSPSAANRLERVRISHGGREPAFDGNLALAGAQTRLVARDVALEDGAGVGLWLDRSLPGVSIEAPTFAGNRVAQVREAGAARDFDAR